ncbi:MAG: hypothetical protein H6932_14215 [Burkholderiaceae bacterium]|uniref:PDZ domain-containing protein n=1 Tax=Rubrivivax albus TaxID=2499835 RepID=A0A3S3S9A4_9BURK|nr:hypothetical protein [Rubrivivax albus]MCP5272360.1 hypothetical protein [Burkholderiaceae bacterium]RVT48833.1 hypothetical protein ENE75_20950 [Rubrivivax albus]
MRALAAVILAAWLLPAQAQQTASYDPKDFKRVVFKTRYEREVQFRAAAIQVAWSAEVLCDATTEIEPFVLWSLGTVGRRLDSDDLSLYTEVTGMDEQWRVAWLDEGAPDDLHVGDVVVAVNGRQLPQGGTRFDFGAILRGSSPLSNSEQPFWDVMLQAREEAKAGKPMTVTLKDGRTLEVDTQTGCAGSVTATGFDHEPDRFERNGAVRVKIPANAMLEARARDEFRWLAAFGTYFQASEKALGKARDSANVATAFVVGKILAAAVPGAGMLLSAAEQQAERAIAVDSVVGSADLFANEVVAAMGGDVNAGWRLNERFAELGLQVDALQMDAFRLSNAKEHAQRVADLRAAQARAAAAAEAAERRAQEEARRQPLVLPVR